MAHTHPLSADSGSVAAHFLSSPAPQSRPATRGRRVETWDSPNHWVPFFALLLHNLSLPQPKLESVPSLEKLTISFMLFRTRKQTLNV